MQGEDAGRCIDLDVRSILYDNLRLLRLLLAGGDAGIVSVPVQGIDCPVQQRFIGCRYMDFAVVAYGGVVTAVQRIEVDAVAFEQPFETAVEYQVFRYTLLQSVGGGEQPEPVGQYESLFDVVGR